MMKPESVVLEGTHVRLVPMAVEHIPALWEAGNDPELWHFTLTQIHSEDDMRRYVETALRLREQGTALPFVTTEAATGRVIGSTRFGNVDAWNRRVEIGWTWIAAPWQRSPINTEAKFLMLRHAFETLGCIRVELKTSALNEKSRRAITRIGGREEGILRKHAISEDGRIRDTVYFGIVDDEWPGVRSRLLAMMAQPRS